MSKQGLLNVLIQRRKAAAAAYLNADALLRALATDQQLLAALSNGHAPAAAERARRALQADTLPQLVVPAADDAAPVPKPKPKPKVDGRSKSWSPAQRQAQAERLRQRWLANRGAMLKAVRKAQRVRKAHAKAKA